MVEKSSVHWLHEVSWEFHPHEDPSCKEWDQNADEPNRYEDHSTEFRGQWVVSLVQDYEAERTDSEHEGSSQTFHDVLTIDSIRHECNWSWMAMFINSCSNTWRFDNNIIDESCKTIVGQKTSTVEDTHLHRPWSMIPWQIWRLSSPTVTLTMMVFSVWDWVAEPQGMVIHKSDQSCLDKRWRHSWFRRLQLISDREKRERRGLCFPKNLMYNFSAQLLCVATIITNLGCVMSLTSCHVQEEKQPMEV